MKGEKKVKIDDKTFSAIYEQYMNDVYRFAYSILKNHEDAENAMQDTFFKLYTSPPKNFTNIKSWLMSTSKHLCIDEIRRRKKETTINLEIRRNIGNYTNGDGNQTQVLIFVSQLSKKYSEVVRLYYYGNLTIEEISKTLKISGSNVKKRLERARKKLKELMEENKNESD